MAKKTMYIRDGRAPVPKQEVTSRIMSRVRGKNTKPEVAFRKELRSEGLGGYKLHPKSLPGRPDVYFPSQKLAIFINGCFWHAHQGCKHFSLPKTNRPFWEQKLQRNKERDQEVLAALLQEGYRVLVVWECELSPPLRREETLFGLVNEIWQVES